MTLVVTQGIALGIRPKFSFGLRRQRERASFEPMTGEAQRGTALAVPGKWLSGSLLGVSSVDPKREEQPANEERSEEPTTR